MAANYYEIHCPLEGNPTLRLLILDIETSPMVADLWGLYNQNVGLSQLRESTRMICFAAKWYGKPKTYFFSEFHDGREEMLKALHGMMDEADILMHYNGDKFDLKHINREFLLAGMTPPSPSNSIDLYKVVRKQFLFPSNKLAYVSTALGLEGKISNGGHELWIKCLAGNSKAWNVMRRYNKRDVTLLEDLYNKLLPWIPSHPHRGVLDGVPAGCTNCGSTNLIRQGFAHTQLGKYQRFQCTDCKKWLRSTRRVHGSEFCAVQG